MKGTCEQFGNQRAMFAILHSSLILGICWSLFFEWVCNVLCMLTLTHVFREWLFEIKHTHGCRMNHVVQRKCSLSRWIGVQPKVLSSKTIYTWGAPTATCVHLCTSSIMFLPFCIAYFWEALLPVNSWSQTHTTLPQGASSQPGTFSVGRNRVKKVLSHAVVWCCPSNQSCGCLWVPWMLWFSYRFQMVVQKWVLWSNATVYIGFWFSETQRSIQRRSVDGGVVAWGLPKGCSGQANPGPIPNPFLPPKYFKHVSPLVVDNRCAPCLVLWNNVMRTPPPGP